MATVKPSEPAWAKQAANIIKEPIAPKQDLAKKEQKTNQTAASPVVKSKLVETKAKFDPISQKIGDKKPTQE